MSLRVDPTGLAATTQRYKALSHPARLRILAMLRTGELCACQITAVLDLAPSTVSAHLAELRRAGFVSERRDGRWVHYRLGRGGRFHGMLQSLWRQLDGDPQAVSDANVVERLRRIPVEELCRAGLNLSRVALARADRLSGRASDDGR